ncbi:MAG: hypothetical protein HY778_05400 [Betaproteobacteria bacterium]|nr:hypothetical protein [Betaproteobacteria bacterium]
MNAAVRSRRTSCALRSGALLALLSALAGGCSVAPTLPEAPEAAPPGRAETRDEAARPPARPPRKRLAKPGPIPERPLNVKAQCRFRDETGYQGALNLEVANARVLQFEASVDIPRRGSCHFSLTDFRPVAAPNHRVKLAAPGSRCVVHMWEQGNQVTVGFSDCQDRCSGNAYPYLWPLLADAEDGTCG